MPKDLNDILSVDFLPLSEAKAKLSEQMRKISLQGRRIAITTNGRPTAVLLGYQDFLDLLRSALPVTIQSPQDILDYSQWKKGSLIRKQVSDSIDQLFDATQLSRKGQKPYKQEKVREFTK